MLFDYSLAGLVTAGLMIYLVYALLRPERHHQRGDDRAVEQDLNPADDGHGRRPFRAARA